MPRRRKTALNNVALSVHDTKVVAKQTPQTGYTSWKSVLGFHWMPAAGGRRWGRTGDSTVVGLVKWEPTPLPS